jgi:hypothetical protein
MIQEREENILQGLLASAGFVDSAIKRLAEGKESLTIKHMSNALIILNRLIKSIRGF